MSAELCSFPQPDRIEERARRWAAAQDEAVSCLRLMVERVELAALMGKAGPFLADPELLKRCRTAIAEAERV